MKKITLLNFLLIFSMLKVEAADNPHGINSGKIVYEISYLEDGLDDETKAMLPVESVMYFKGDKTRIEMNMSMGSTTIISDNKLKKGTLLMDFMGNKIAMEINNEEVKKDKEGSGTFKVEKLSGEKKIAGYTCQKAKVTQTDAGKKVSFDVWYSKEIVANNAEANGLDGIDGCMLEYELLQNGNHIRMTTKSVTEMDVKDDLFKIPEGYTYTTKENLKSMMGGGGVK